VSKVRNLVGLNKLGWVKSSHCNIGLAELPNYHGRRYSFPIVHFIGCGGGTRGNNPNPTRRIYLYKVL